MRKEMKTKTVRQPKKVTSAQKTVTKASTSVKIIPGEEQIREKAREIYLERVALGRQGTAEDDWRKAEELLMGK
jgi:hypothetical protein